MNRGSPGKVTCVDKSNVLTSMAYMRGIFDERAKLNPDLDADYCYVDAEGRPMVFHRRRLVFFLPESPPEVNDRTFIESDECR